MGLPIDYGNVPEWLQAAGGLAVVGDLLVQRRRERVVDFARKVEELVGDPDRVREVTTSDAILSIVEKGIEGAARAHAEEKRWLFARVVSAAFSGDDARIDELDVFLSTVSALEPYHIRLFVEIAQPRPGGCPLQGTPLVGAVREAEIAASHDPADRHLIGPLLEALHRQHLVKDVAIGTWDYEQTWSPTEFGRRFLRYLVGGPFGEVGIAHTTVTCWSDRAKGVIHIRNIGLVHARVLGGDVRTEPGFSWTPPPFPAAIAPGDEIVGTCTPPPQNMPITISFSWECDGCGEVHDQTERLPTK